MLLVQEPLSDEADETLSLCDLPLYSDQCVEESWYQDLSNESQGSSSMSSSEDYFEFFSQEICPSTSKYPPQNIIFCGKLIPYKQLDTFKKDSLQVEESTMKQTKIKKNNSWDIFRWRNTSSKKQVQSNSKNYDFPTHKMSILTSSSSVKARWHTFLFGISKFSTVVELKDIKNRQSRRHCALPPPVLRKKSKSGLGGLIRVLSCGGGNQHPNAMVAASITCNQ